MVCLLSLLYAEHILTGIPIGISAPLDVVCSVCHLSGSFSLLFPFQMFIFPAWITMTIAATRMHRLLVDFAFGSTEMYGVLLFLAFSQSLRSI